MDLSDLGLGLAKALARLALAPVPGASLVSDNLVDIVATVISDKREQRSVTRQFELMGDRISLELEAHFVAELGGLAKGEREAALERLLGALASAPISHELILAEDLDPRRLERLLEPNLDSGHLSVGGQAFLDALVREACVYMASCTMALKDFAPRAIAQLLQREREMADTIDEALRAIPKEVVYALSGSDPRVFELSYRREVVRIFDELRLFGLTRPAYGPVRYPLSVAYLTLSASWLRADTEGEARVDAVLSRNRRVVIRGAAGSGKTTLLQWLTVRAAQRMFHGPLADWNSLVPLFIPLRRYALENDLPQPSMFADSGAGVIKDRMPEDWTIDLLTSGRALVLIDGLDEIPRAMLDQVKAWIAGLMVHYGDCTYVVTSRPSALASVSLVADGFEECTLEPMSESDVLTFVGQWHVAAARDVEHDQERAELRNLQTRLEQHLTDRALLALASSPLLCAIICALNRDRLANVPRQKLELYKTAIELLLARRDAEREVHSEQLMTLDEATLLLKDIAYWMVRNNEPTINRDEYQRRIASRITSMPRVNGTPTSVADYLLARSGILREPVDEEIDFIHLSFRDFLAAEALLAEDDISMLLREARVGRLRDVTIFAAGLGSDMQRHRILEGLLEEPSKPTTEGRSTSNKLTTDSDDSTRREGTIFLALACIEVSASVDPAISAKILRLVKTVVPPRTAQGALLIAAAGAPAVESLRRGTETDAWKASTGTDMPAHTVTALAAIGGPEAVSVLEELADDPRKVIRNALATAWSSFQPGEFATRILSRFATGYLPPLIVNSAQLPHVGRLEWARAITLLAPPRDLTLGSLPAESLIRLHIDGFNGDELRDLGSISQLERLTLANADQLNSLGQLSLLPHLRELTLARIDPWQSGEQLADCAALEVLTCVDLAQLEELHVVGKHMRELVLRNCAQLHSLTVDEPRTIRRLVIERVALDDIASYGEWQNLTSATFSEVEGPDLGWLRRLTSLEDLSIVDSPRLLTLTGIENMKALKRLTLLGCWRLEDLQALEEVDSLEALDLRNCASIKDLSPLGRCPRLQSVDLIGCPISLNCSPIAHVPDIEFPYPA